MKKIYLSVIVLLVAVCSQAQAPQAFSYQAVIRNSSNTLVANKAVSERISLIKDSATGTVVYSELLTSKTNANGLVSLQIGTGSVLSGSFSGINWATGIYFIKTETDPTGGSNYNISNTTQLLSVPFALYAASGGTAGAKGDSGVSVRNTVVNGDSLYITLSTGQRINAGNVRGLTGAKGDTGFLKNSSTIGSTPYWNGTQWVVNSSNIYNNGNYVGIGKSNPSANLEVGGTIKASQNQGPALQLEQLKDSTNYYISIGTNNDHLFIGNKTTTLFEIQNNTGNAFIGTNGTSNGNFNAKLEVYGGDVYISNPTSGLIMKSPIGGCWKVTVDNNGNLVTKSITCP